MPRPTDAPVAHAAGVTPDRVLVIGSGTAVGYGVLSWDLSISGEIARQVALITNRGMDVDIIADPDLDIAMATGVLREVRIARYDAILLVLGPIEVMTLYPRRRWRRDLIRLLDWLADEGPASLNVLVVGVPPFEKLLHLPVLGLFAKQGRTLNGITETVVEGRRNVTFVPLNPKAEDLVRNAGRDVQARWAGFIAPFVAAALDDGAPVRADVVDEAARMAALLRLRVLDSPPDDNIQEIIDVARSLFGASGAAFNFIDHDRQWTKAAAGLAKGSVEMPRSGSICSTTIEQSRLLVIEDMTKDPLYRDDPFVTGPPGLRFYAGYPIEAPDGQRVGSLCIMDTKARTFSKAEATLLRDLALRVQAMVWDRPGAQTTLGH